MLNKDFEFQKLKFEIQRIKFEIQRFIFEFQKWIKTIFFEIQRSISTSFHYFLSTFRLYKTQLRNIHTLI